MKVTYVVHGASMSTAPFKVEHEGKTLNATVDCLEVELTGEDPRHGSFTHRFIGDEAIEAEQLFKPNARIVATFVSEEKTEQAKAAVKEKIKA